MLRDPIECFRFYVNRAGACPLKSSSSIEIHILTSNTDAELATWALCSWYGIGRRTDALCIHDDGSLQRWQCNRFRKLFPGCRIIGRRDADKLVYRELSDYPELINFRKMNNLSIKVLDFFFFANTNKFVILDSDILTFSPLNDIDEWLAESGNIFLRDYHKAFSMDVAGFKSLRAARMYKRINTGFGVVDISTLNLARASDAIAAMNCDRHPYWAEQTLYAVLSRSIGVRLLDPEFCVARTTGLAGIKMKHYVWKTRDLAWSEGIPHVAALLQSC